MEYMNELKPKCRWYQFHQWRELNSISSREYMGEKYVQYSPTHKICEKCGLIKEYHYDSQGGYWEKLNADEQRILEGKVQERGGKLVIILKENK